MKKTVVIKIGGAILAEAQALSNLLESLKQQDINVVIVHGGGYLVDELLAKAGFTTEKLNGLRVTPPEQMPIISGVLAGTVNKSIVAKANALGIKTAGLSLLDGELVKCKPSDPELGAVGIPEPNNSKLLDQLINTGVMPVISSIGALPNGELVNVNADDAAVAVCQLLNAQLVLLTDVNGVKGQNGQYLPQLNQQQANELIHDGVISGGMTAKVNAALQAAKKLRRSIAVASWQHPEQINQLLAGEPLGTRIDAF